MHVCIQTHTHTHTCAYGKQWISKLTKLLHIDTYRQIQIPFLHFTLFGSFGIHAKDTNFIFGIPQTYTCTDTQTCTHMDTHMYRDIDTQIQIHRDICMFVYKHTHTHTDVHVGNLRNCYFKSTFKSKLTKLVTLNMKFEEIVT